MATHCVFWNRVYFLWEKGQNRRWVHIFILEMYEMFLFTSHLSTPLNLIRAKFRLNWDKISYWTWRIAETTVFRSSKNGQKNGSDWKVQFEILNNDNSVNCKAKKLIKTTFLSQICRRIQTFMSYGLILTSCGDT